MPAVAAAAVPTATEVAAAAEAAAEVAADVAAAEVAAKVAAAEVAAKVAAAEVAAAAVAEVAAKVVAATRKRRRDSQRAPSSYGAPRRSGRRTLEVEKEKVCPRGLCPFGSIALQVCSCSV